MVGRDLYINGTIINPGATLEGKPANARMVQAISDFDQGDVSGWDADANTSAFISALPTYKSYGLNAITINLQGGLPQDSDNITWATDEGYQNTGWNTDGSFKAAWEDRLTDVLDAMMEQHIIPIVGLFYFRQEHWDNEAAILNAVDNAKTLLEPWKSAIIVEVANECNMSLWDSTILQDGASNVKTLIDEMQAAGYYATTSYTPGVPDTATMEDADVVLLHGNNQTVTFINNTTSTALTNFPGVPVFFNEDGPPAHSDEATYDWDGHFNACATHSNGPVGWGFYYQSGLQDAVSPTLDWTIDDQIKQDFFDDVATYTGNT